MQIDTTEAFRDTALVRIMAMPTGKGCGEGKEWLEKTRMHSLNKCGEYAFPASIDSKFSEELVLFMFLKS